MSRRRGIPRPPREIELEMEAAGKAGDEVRLGLARARYQAWLVDRGYGQPQLQGWPTRGEQETS